MRVTAKKSRKTKTDDSYFTLVQHHPLRAIRSKAEYITAADVLDGLAVRDDLDFGEREYLDALEILIGAYDDRIEPITRDRRNSCERLKALIRNAGVSDTRLREILGISQSMTSMLLSGDRALSKKAIAKLAEIFNIDPSYFF
ncbi:MAG: helix-turn-helix domain-containing protein [Phycisphaerae bacterium]|nr:helix-turn-helix domain-containing protein [Phycisphaerae bacterium]